MAQLDTSIYSNYLAPPKSVEQYDAEANQAKMGQLGYQNALRQQQEDVAYRQAAKNFGSDPTANYNNLLQQGLPAQAAAYQKAALDGRKSMADIAELGAKTSGMQQDQQIKSHTQALQDLASVSTPEDAHAWALNALKSGALTPDQFQRGAANLPSDPAQVDQWKRNTQAGGMTVLEQMQATIAKPTEMRLGNVVKTIDMNPRSTTFGTEMVPQQAIGTSPDTVASNATAIKTTGMNNATSIANNKAQIAKDYAVAGMDQNGNFLGGANGMGGLVDALGQYKVPEGTALARVPPAMKAQIMAQLADKYPNYDPTQLAVVQKAAKDFATGPQGQQIQATNTALNHLDTIKQLALAQKNGDYQLVNKLFNTIGAQTGNPAPTNTQAAVQMVAPEITKAVVGAGGGVGERGDFAKSLNGNFAPDQLLGVAGTMQDLLGGRLAEMQRTYQRTTGRKDFSDALLSPAGQQVLLRRQSSALPTTPNAQPAAPINTKGGPTVSNW